MKLVDSRFSPPFFVSESISGVYGDDIWENAWEPDQQSFISQVLANTDSIFIDVGAAVGVYTLLAAALGKKVYAIEPANLIFGDLKRNVMANVAFSESVHLINSFVVSKTDTTRKLGGFAQQNSILEFTEFNLALEELLQSGNFVIKMDIEGAEWALLQDRNFLKTLSGNQFILFLSLHIGFHHFDGHTLGEKLRYRFGVIKEILTLLKLRLRFEYFFELRSGELKKVSFIKRNLFNGNSWHPNPVLISNSAELIASIRRFRA